MLGLYDTLGIYKYKDYDEAINDTWDEIDDIIADESTYDTKAIAEDERRLDSIVSGTLQTIGGGTEATLGGATATAGYATVDPLPIAGGTYLVADGASNFSGGVSKVTNAIWGNNEGDTWNFMKNEYIKMSPKYGENIYNVTQVVSGCYSLNKDLSAIPSDVVKVYPRAKNIIRAENEGLEASTSVLDIGNKVVITTKTESGMILTRTVIDKAEDISAVNKALIGTDAYNTESSAESIK